MGYADADTRFKYGSIGAENDAGIPYWIFYVLPRMFPEKLPGPGGYASLGVPWEQGQELPVGFTKKVIGFPRVANNCAVCHSTRLADCKPNEKPIVIAAGPGQTTNVEGFFRFLVDCAKDPRFNADNLMREIRTVTKLVVDRQGDLSLPDHSDHEEAAARTRAAVRVGLPRGRFRSGAAAATTR